MSIWPYLRDTDHRADFSRTKDNPVIQVPNVVILVLALECQEREIPRHQVAHYAGQQRVSVKNWTESKQYDKDSQCEHTRLDFVFLLYEGEALHLVEVDWSQPLRYGIEMFHVPLK